METESSLPHSQQPVTCPYPEPDQSSPCPLSTWWRSISIFFSQLRLRFPSGLFPPCLPTKTVYAALLSPTHATSPAHLFSLPKFKITRFKTYWIFGNILKNSLTTFLKLAPISVLREWKMTEEYCWAITRAERRSCCCRSDSGVLEFGLHMHSLVYSWS